MLNYLLVPLVGDFGFLRIFNYISFRAAGAAVTALLVSFIVGPLIIQRLRRMRLHQVIREGTPDSHQEKKRTPTMGGLIILAATLIPTFLWAKLNNRYVLIAMFVNVGMWLERVLIVLNTLSHDYTPSMWRIFFPTIWDWLLLFGSLGLFGLLYLLLVRVFPMVSMHEVRQLIFEEKKA